MRYPKLGCGVLLATALAADFSAAAFVGDGPVTQHYQSVESALKVSIDFDYTAYRLSFANNGEYKLFAAVLENTGPTPIGFSRSEDVFTVDAKGHRIQGILDLARANPQMWDTLDPDLRQALLYPAELDAHKRCVIYILAPASDLSGKPESFTFHVKSLGRALVIQTPPAMAR